MKRPLREISSYMTQARAVFIFLAVALLAAFLPAAANSEEIKKFHSDIFVDENGSLTVVEDIEYDFQYAQRRGIYRYIPYKYDYGYKRYSIKIDVEKVTDFDGNPYQYKVSTEGAVVNIRIGDPDKTITGVHGYRIEYTVRGAVAFFEEYDELYWNVTGDEWRVPINEAGARIYLPEGSREGIQAECYTGPRGATGKDCTASISGGEAEFGTSRVLWAGEGLTIVTGFPKGLVKEPTGSEKIGWFLRDNWFFVLPFATLFGMFYIWSTSGRDPDGRGSIMVRYSPPEGFTPAEAGTLIDERADVADITSTVIDLAVRGYLRIEEHQSTKLYFFTDRDYKLIKTKEPAPGELKPHEQKVLAGIFKTGGEVEISDLRNKFYRELPGITKSLYSELVKGGYFPGDPEKVKGIYKWIGIILLIVGFALFTNFLLKVSIALSGLIILAWSGFMPKKTKQGALAKEELFGFREFIDRAEKDRIEALAKDDPTLFDRVLPFALVFGLEDRWAEAFRDMYREPPSWYSSPGYMNSFTPRLFVADLGRSLGVMNSTFASAPRKSGGSGLGGGGSSGGGFGGGGGGSW